jgi:hypothetical protein
MIIDNFVQFAMKHYENPHVTTIDEFERDLDKFSHINKLLYRYYDKDDLNARLILNHIIVLYNVFSIEACTEMIFFKIKPEYVSAVKTFLTFLNYMPAKINTLNIKDTDIPIDMRIADELRKI